MHQSTARLRRALRRAVARRLRLVRHTGLAMVLVALGLSIPSISAPAAADTVGGFEIDGNLVAAGAIDWASPSVAPQPVAHDLTSTNDDDAFTQGSKEEVPGGWVTTTKPNTPKDDLGDIYGTTRIAGNHLFAFLGWERESGTGTTNLTIELNHLDAITNSEGVAAPNRSPGDVLIAVEQSGNSLPDVGGVFKWVNGDWTSVQASAFGIEAAANSGTVTDTDQNTLPEHTFGEISVDLTAIFDSESACSLGGFATLSMRTRASTSITSELKDYVLPASINDACAPVSPTPPPAPKSPDCDTDGSATIPADTASVVYWATKAAQTQQDGVLAPGTWTLHAALATPGTKWKLPLPTGWSTTNSLDGELTATLVVGAKTSDCPVTPAAVPVTPASCETNGSATIPADTADVTYWATRSGATQDNGDLAPGVWTVHASLNSEDAQWSNLPDGWKPTDATKQDIEITVTVEAKTGDCPVTPAAVPTVSPADCDTAGSATIPGDTALVRYWATMGQTTKEDGDLGVGTWTLHATILDPDYAWTNIPDGWLPDDAVKEDLTATVQVPAADPSTQDCAPEPKKTSGVAVAESCETGGYTSTPWTAISTPVWDGSAWVYGEPDYTYYDSTFTPYDDAEYFTKCAPPEPPQETRVVLQSNESCDLNQVGGVETWTTTYTTTYSWDTETRTWVGTEDQGVDSTPVFTPYTDEEYYLNCAPVQPDDQVVTSEWTDGLWGCGDTTVTQTRTVTTTPYVWDAETRTYIPDTANATVVTQTQTRELTEEEIDSLDCALEVGDIAAECVSVIPSLAYEVIEPTAGRRVSARVEGPLTITFVGAPDHDDVVYTGLPLAGTLLWPGASDGNPPMWPGWDYVDGEYVDVDDQRYGWTRDGVTVRFEVGAESYEVVVDYPGESEICANPPIGTDEPISDDEPTDEPDEPTDEPDEPDSSEQPIGQNPTTGGSLPYTGAPGNVVWAGLGGLMLILAGAVMIAARRRRV